MIEAVSDLIQTKVTRGRGAGGERWRNTGERNEWRKQESRKELMG